MFQKGKASTVPSENQAKEKLASYVYEYLIHIGAPKAAHTFLQEIHCDKPWPIGEPPGFLSLWWCVFYDLYNAAPERRETSEHSSEAKAFHDYGFVTSGISNGLPRNPSIASPISGGMPPSGGRPPSSQGIMPSDTPVPIPGGQMMVQGGPFFPPNHPSSNMGVPSIEMIRNRSMMQHQMRFSPHQGPVGPMVGNYHPSQVAQMHRHRYNPQQSSVGLVHSPGPSGVSQAGGPPIMPSPNDPGLQGDGIQSSSGPESFSGGGSSRSPSHVMSQPAPAFPPPPASENSSDQSGHGGGGGGLMNGGGGNGGGPQFPQQQQQQSHTMEYLPSSGAGGMPFEGGQMKHSPQMHHNDVIASMGNGGMPSDFCGSMLGNGPAFPPEHHGRPLHLQGMPPLSQQIHMMQQQQAGHHGQLSMQAMQGGPPLPSQFLSHQGVPISAAAASSPFPDYSFTSMSQAI